MDVIDKTAVSCAAPVTQTSPLPTHDADAAAIFSNMFLNAEEHQCAGQFDEAEALYQQMLELQPDHPDVNHNFGVMCIQRGRRSESLDFLQRALSAATHREDLWAVFAEALVLNGKLDTARELLMLGRNAGHALSGVNIPKSRPSMSRAFDEIVLLSPPLVTGGPEAIHQLAQSINMFGGNAKVAYYGGNSKLEFAGNVLRCVPNLSTEFEEAFAHYQVPALHETTLTPNTLLIFPEVLSEFASGKFGARKAIWWLSVDNALLANPKLADTTYARTLLGASDVLHFYQSDYARSFLERNLVRRMHPLFDFTNRDYVAHAPDAKSSNKPYDVALFPRKGGQRAAQFIASAPHIRYAKIEGMTRHQVREVLRESAVYIDFGDHPGKDRVPREAAASGAVVLLHRRGAAAHFADHPLDDFYLFDEEEIANGVLLAKVQGILLARETHVNNQWQYRQRVVMEQAEFESQIQSLFFKSH